jgi:hypothetical protein
MNSSSRKDRFGLVVDLHMPHTRRAARLGGAAGHGPGWRRKNRTRRSGGSAGTAQRRRAVSCQGRTLAARLGSARESRPGYRSWSPRGPRRLAGHVPGAFLPSGERRLNDPSAEEDLNRSTRAELLRWGRSAPAARNELIRTAGSGAGGENRFPAGQVKLGSDGPFLGERFVQRQGMAEM